MRTRANLLNNNNSVKINGIEIKKPPVKYIEKIEKYENQAILDAKMKKMHPEPDIIDSPEKNVKYEMRT
jgi:hypothetical protein